MAGKEDIIAGKGKPNKKIAKIVFAILSILMVAFFAVVLMTSGENKNDKSKQEGAVLPNKELHAQRVAEQKEAAIKKAEEEAKRQQEQKRKELERQNAAAQQTGISPNGMQNQSMGPSYNPVGGAASAPVAVPGVAPAANIQDQGARGRAFSEGDKAAMVANSAIIALEDGGKHDSSGTAAGAAAALGLPAGLPELQGVSAPPPGLSEEEKRLIGTGPADQASQAAPSKAKQDVEWAQGQNKPQPAQILSEDPFVGSYVIYQGTLIPAVITSDINSDLPGEVSAMVTQNVYDSRTGSVLMIPMGTRLEGVYNNDIKLAQERVQAAFHTMIFPDGRTVTLGGMGGADQRGSSGLKGEVDTHFWRVFRSSFLVAGLAYLLERKNQVTVNNYGTTVGGGGNAYGAAGSILVDIAKKSTAADQNLLPTIRLRIGDKFNLRVNKHIAIRPYRMAARGSR